MTESNPELLDTSQRGLPSAVPSLAAPDEYGHGTEYVSKMHMHSQDTSQQTIEHEREIIRAQPDVSEEDVITYDDEGWDSRVYILNGGQVCYKFPRSAEVMSGYWREIAALNMINGLEVGVRTQRFKEIDATGRYFSYFGIVGTQLSELMSTIDESEKQRFGSEIGSFLKVLHASEMEGAPIVTVHDEIKEYKAKYELATPAIEGNFTTHERAVIAGFFYDRMPYEMERLGGAITLCHGDLGSYNIIIGEDGTPGIIDFGNLGYYDQSKDFIDFGDDAVLAAAYQTYGDSPQLRAKTHVRMIAMQAIDLVYFMGKKDKDGLDTTVGKLRTALDDIRNNNIGGGS